MSRPLIAISPNVFPAEARRFYSNKALEYGEASMAEAVRQAGGIPTLLYRAETPDAEIDAWAEALISRVDGLILAGGDDISPTHYGEEPGDPAWAGNLWRDTFELALYRAAVAAHVPVLGICRGAQLIGVAEGGALWQDLPSMYSSPLKHRDQDLYDGLYHALKIESPWLEGVFGDDPHEVNSVHHQALKEAPPSLKVLARAPDGVLEAYTREDAWVLGLQWHPEWMQDRPGQRRLFSALIHAARHGDRSVL